jgi:ubiquinone/menaquinone biosynthesis C-methylase UbiE
MEIGSKSLQWRHYYEHLIERARRDGVTTAEAIDAGWADPRRMADVVLPHLTPDAIVLEIACGVGRISRFMAPHCRRLYCADILPDALEEAKAALAQVTNVSFHQTNGYDLQEFESGMFDAVFSFTSFFHFDLELVVQYFGEIARVLKVGGVAIIEFKKLSEQHELDQLVTKIAIHGGIESYEAMLDKWRYVSLEMLALLCRRHGLEIINDDVTRFTFRKPAPRRTP